MEKNNFKENLRDFKFLIRKGVVVLVFGILVAYSETSRQKYIEVVVPLKEKTEIPKNKNKKTASATVDVGSVFKDSLNYEEQVGGNKGGEVFDYVNISDQTESAKEPISENKDDDSSKETENTVEKSQTMIGVDEKLTKDTGAKPKNKPKELPKFDLETSSKARVFLDNFQIVLDKRDPGTVVNYLKERIGDYKDHICTSVGQIPILKDKHSDFINSLEEDGYFVFNEDSENLEIKKNLKISTALLVLDLLEKKHLEGIFRIKAFHKIFISEKEVITNKINKRIKEISKDLPNDQKEQILLKIVFEESDYIARGFYRVYFGISSKKKDGMLAKEMTAIFKENPDLELLLKDFISGLAKK